MQRCSLPSLFPAVGILLAACAGLSAQDIAITNVRVIVGSGPVIENGTIIVRGGKIASVGAGKRSEEHTSELQSH